MIDHHYMHPTTITPTTAALQRGVLSGAGVDAEELGVVLGCGGQVVRAIRVNLGRDPVDGQPGIAPVAPQREDIDHMMRANRSAL